MQNTTYILRLTTRHQVGNNAIMLKRVNMLGSNMTVCWTMNNKVLHTSSTHPDNVQAIAVLYCTLLEHVTDETLLS